MTSDQITKAVIAAFQATFEGVAIDTQSDFFELGGDSLALVALCASLETQLGCSIHPSDLLYHPSIEELGAELAPRMSDLKTSN